MHRPAFIGRWLSCPQPPLTKSLFALGIECPTKTFYAKDKRYANKNLDDDFLQALAEGGFQVGALAQCMFPGGELIDTLNKAKALKKTNESLQLPRVTLFEAAVAHKNLLVRTDILVKTEQGLSLYEVKAKSWEPGESFLHARGHRLEKKWEPYLLDVAFQTHVLRLAFPECGVTPSLMLVDKSKATSIDGLNQKFKINYSSVSKASKVLPVGDLSPAALGDPILSSVSVAAEVDGILDGSLWAKDGRAFIEWVDILSKAVGRHSRPVARLGTLCKQCEFQATDLERSHGLRSGFHECWSKEGGLSAKELQRPTVLELWNFRAAQKHIEAGKLLVEQLSEEDFPKKDSRQYLQYSKIVKRESSPFIDKAGIRAVMDKVEYPLHFIDFETSMLALPFHKNRQPYEQYSFQFSHHQMEADGQYRHAGQFLGTEPGRFPNFDFLRRLKAELENDLGTVFRYAAHENTVLKQIIVQLEDSTESDRSGLISFAKTLIHDTETHYVGTRDMVDLLAWVKAHYYHPSMKGSNSIKAVFPAILNSSDYLKRKYAVPIYGSAIPSLNFGPTAMAALDPETGLVTSPYKILPPVWEGRIVTEKSLYYGDEDAINEGGAAMTAFARLQFCDVPNEERRRVEQALLRYCEIDTLAMVMLWEGWREA